VIDDHYRSLTVLANTLGQYGVALEAGQRVITGSYSKHDVAPGESWRAEFAGIGAVELKFT
jgi:2-keto-4-pentenoate hydratase/2-oxopent-4-enoate/cis-2-oxohex-4-enoate hydratase